MAVISPPEKKLAKRTSVDWGISGCFDKLLSVVTLHYLCLLFDFCVKPSETLNNATKCCIRIEIIENLNTLHFLAIITLRTRYELEQHYTKERKIMR